ncbi:MAG: threonylcarbamoyl-AMP synthase [Chloroflexi bacterium]|nr:threonylcarbamoyl-AMP synthase [Chloroflexota bacterium]
MWYTIATRFSVKIIVTLEEFAPELQKQVEKGIEILKRGGIVAFPTDTVYGLGARFDYSQAVERIYRVKERPRTMALPLLLADPAQMSDVAVDVPMIAGRLAESFWPGALTLVLRKSKLVSELVTAGERTVAVRMPAHPVPLALIGGVGVPIIGTSANVSGQPSPVTAHEVDAQLNGRVDLIIDGGRCPVGVESTVVDVTGVVPVILREGAISLEQLARVCGKIVLHEERAGDVR